MGEISQQLYIFDDSIDALSNSMGVLQLAYRDRSVGVLDKVKTVKVRDCIFPPNSISPLSYQRVGYFGNGVHYLDGGRIIMFELNLYGL